MSSAIANIEGCPLVEGTPKTRKQLSSEVRALSTRLRVQDTLRAYNLTLSYVGTLKRSDAKLLLVHMKPEENKVEVRGFRLRESQLANDAYTDLEKNLDPQSAAQAVLVKVDSLQALQRAYPNYFLDTERFTAVLSQVLNWR
jgi:hypothetical protein